MIAFSAVLFFVADLKMICLCQNTASTALQLKQYEVQLLWGCTYTTRALTNGTQLSAIEIVVPPKPEQEAIAKSLTEIDDLISSLEKLITKKKSH